MSVNWKKVGIKAGGVAIGTVAAGMICKSMPATITDLYKGVGCVVLGAMLPNFAKGELMEAIGSGIIAVGAQKLASNFGFQGISGIEGAEQVEYSAEARNTAIEQANNQVSEYIAATQELEEAVNGLAEESAMVGTPDDENMIAEDLAYAM